MNIRSLSNPAQILAKDKVEAQSREITSSSATDRDANGKRDTSQEEKPWRSLTDEELAQVLDKLRNHEGIQKHQLQVNLYELGDKRYAKIENDEGHVIKQISEQDLFYYLFEEQTNNFNLVKKTA